MEGGSQIISFLLLLLPWVGLARAKRLIISFSSLSLSLPRFRVRGRSVSGRDFWNAASPPFLPFSGSLSLSEGVVGMGWRKLHI